MSKVRSFHTPEPSSFHQPPPTGTPPQCAAILLGNVVGSKGALPRRFLLLLKQYLIRLHLMPEGPTLEACVDWAETEYASGGDRLFACSGAFCRKTLEKHDASPGGIADRERCSLTLTDCQGRCHLGPSMLLRTEEKTDFIR